MVPKSPLNILRRKGTPLDGNNPTILYGYGGYGLNEVPRVKLGSGPGSIEAAFMSTPTCVVAENLEKNGIKLVTSPGNRMCSMISRPVEII